MAEPAIRDDFAVPEGAAAHTPQTRQERIDYGRTVLDAVDGEAGQRVINALADISPVLAEQAMSGCEPQLEVHVNAALNVGLSPQQIVEALLHSSAYCGFPRALNATFAAKRVFAERGLLPLGEAG